MSKSHEPAPFATLGVKLKTLREKHKESLAEAAGAVEIAEEQLERIEEGLERPSEEILMLLINHFGTREDDAVRLWELAGYDHEDPDDDTEGTIAKTIVMAVAMDPRIVYSDQVQVNGTKHGVVLTFAQPGGGQLPQMPVARIGMSRSQAKQLLVVLKDTLEQLDKHHPDQPRQLPSGE